MIPITTPRLAPTVATAELLELAEVVAVLLDVAKHLLASLVAGSEPKSKENELTVRRARVDAET